nr:CPBP family intramembrane glutamic endopeptidase [Burkholderia pseudomallei]
MESAGSVHRHRDDHDALPCRDGPGILDGSATRDQHGIAVPSQNAHSDCRVRGLPARAPPIVEELAFRHFLLSVLPFRANRIAASIAVVATALYFSHVHDYQYWTTDAEIFLVGVLLAIARIRSNGLLLPVALHAYAIAVALLLDLALRHLGR